MEITYKEEGQEEDDDASNNAPFDGIRNRTRPPPIRAQGICADGAAVSTPSVTPSEGTKEQLYWRHLTRLRAPVRYGLENEARSTGRAQGARQKTGDDEANRGRGKLAPLRMTVPPNFRFAEGTRERVVIIEMPEETSKKNCGRRIRMRESGFE